MRSFALDSFSAIDFLSPGSSFDFFGFDDGFRRCEGPLDAYRRQLRRGAGELEGRGCRWRTRDLQSKATFERRVSWTELLKTRKAEVMAKS